MSEFRFRQFSVKNEASAMKVGTDAVLLGAAMTLRPSDRSLLDVGTGTGVIALMAAQRLAALPTDSRPVTDMSAATIAESLPADACPAIGIPPTSAFQIEAIDIDPASAAEAAENFAASPWSTHLRAHCIPLSRYCADGLDLIFSNPPYYDSSLKNPDARESAARHTETLSYRELCAFAEAHLKPEGRLSLILPADCEKDLLRTAASFGLYPFRLLRIRTTPAKPVSRLIAEFSRTRIPVPCLTTDPHQPGHTSPQVASTGPHQPDQTCPQVAAVGPQASATSFQQVELAELTLMDSSNNRSPEYTTLTEEFYL